MLKDRRLETNPKSFVYEKVKSNHFKIFYDSLTFSIQYSGVIQSHAEMELDLNMAINTVDVSFHAIQHFVMTCPANFSRTLANICARNFTQHDLENYKK